MFICLKRIGLMMRSKSLSLSLQNNSLMDGSFNGEESYHHLQQWTLDSYLPLEWGREEVHHEANFLMSSATLHPNQMKMEL